MKVIFEKKYELKGGKANRLDVSICYQKGDDYDRRRGYFLSVCPVHVNGMIVTYEGWSGLKKFLKPVLRKSAKTEKSLEEEYDKIGRAHV